MNYASLDSKALSKCFIIMFFQLSLLSDAPLSFYMQPPNYLVYAFAAGSRATWKVYILLMESPSPVVIPTHPDLACKANSQTPMPIHSSILGSPT